jgi:DNA modification methylase
LQRESAREERDERHIAPLQLEVIRRAVRLWTNPGDIVLSPFAGIGSEGYVSIQEGRRFVGVELKRSYWIQAVANLERAVFKTNQPSLFGDEDVA